ncbi:effector-associated domain EAD1-containing protein [Streptomyces sp. NPDC097704]|uniref:effector-associated domain EAD1-containing protein n=1 Tax=Streptomyces sp. NPDC097704 TaxID=3157101 RepID=UPI00331E5EED
MSILDLRRFPRTHKDAEDLLEVLITLYWKEPPTSSLVEKAGLRRADFSWNAPMSDVWPEILRRAAAQGRLRALVEAVDRDPESAAQKIIKALLAERADSDREVFGLSLIGKKAPQAVFDRDELRGHLRELASGDARVLVLTGDSGCGKSYSLEFVIYALGLMGVSTGHVDFRRWAGSLATPAGIMRDLAHQLDWTLRTTVVGETEDTQARMLLSWFLENVRENSEGVWVCFDGPHEDRLTPPAMRLVKDIAVAAEQRTEVAGLRVVLADFDDMLPDVDRTVLRERIKPIGVPQLEAFFRAVAAEVGEEPDQDAIAVLIGELLGNGPLPSPPPLRELSLSAADIALAAFPVDV